MGYVVEMKESAKMVESSSRGAGSTKVSGS